MKPHFKTFPLIILALLFFIACKKSDDGGQLFVRSFDDGSWTEQTDFPGAGRTAASSFSIEDKGYIICGWIDGTGSKLGKEFWEYDKATDTWTQKDDFPGAGRNAATGFAIGNKGYLVCGWSEDHSSVLGKQFWEWDQTTDKWTQKTDFPGEARTSASGFAIGTKGYMLCGWIENGNSQLGKEIWEWDQTTDKWTQKSDFPGEPRNAASGFAIGSKGYLVCGNIEGNGSQLGNEIWEWDQTRDKWTQMTDFSGAARNGASSFTIGSNSYLIGGWVDGNGSRLGKEFWKYQ